MKHAVHPHLLKIAKVDIGCGEQDWRERLDKPGSLVDRVPEDREIALNTRERFTITVEVFRVIYVMRLSARTKIRESDDPQKMNMWRAGRMR